MIIGAARTHKDSRSSDGKTEAKRQALDNVLIPRGRASTKEAIKREQKQKAGEFASDESHFYIIDARSPLAAKANEIGGKGVEDSSHYCIGKATIEYMYIGNIHRVRESLHALLALLVKQPGTVDMSDDSKWFSRLEATHWHKHIRMILEGSVRIVEIMDIKQSSVLCHCSDGWDRTSQLCATAELLMDPYYRTLRGLAVLIEKDWCSFGHKFHERTNCGGDTTKPDDVSPIALQFVEVIWQIMRQFPCAFEYDERYLLAILDAMYSARFGTFLFNCEKERMDNNVYTGGCRERGGEREREREREREKREGGGGEREGERDAFESRIPPKPLTYVISNPQKPFRYGLICSLPSTLASTSTQSTFRASTRSGRALTRKI